MFTSKGYVVKVSGCFYCLYFSTNVEVLNTISKISNGWMSRVVSTKHLDSFLYEIWLIDILNWVANSQIPFSTRYNARLPVMIASNSSSRGSRNAKRLPGAMERRSIS